MKKHISLALLCFFFNLTIVFATSFDITAKHVILYNMNDYSVIYEEKADEKVSIASLTKIVTSLVTLENVVDLDSEVIITASDFAGTTGYATAGFKIGEKVTYRDLLYATLLPSGAETANALANNTFNSYDLFIDAMNELVNNLGLTNTKFANPIGKDNENNYSTAKDVAAILKYALDNDDFKSIFTTKEYTASNGLKLKSTTSNYANILNTSLIIGSKSGFTKNAGRCLASISSYNGVNYLLVVLNSDKEINSSAVEDTITIYEYYNDNYSYQDILSKDYIVTTLPVQNSKTKEYAVKSSEDIEMYLENDTKDNLNYVFDGVREIKADTKEGTKLGDIKVYHDDTLLYESPVYLEVAINYYHPIYWVSLIILAIILIIGIIIVKRKRRRKWRR